jgi:hypothetical protein
MEEVAGVAKVLEGPGCRLELNQVGKGQEPLNPSSEHLGGYIDCSRALASFSRLSNVLAYKPPLEAHLSGTASQHGAELELTSFPSFDIALGYKTA